MVALELCGWGNSCSTRAVLKATLPLGNRYQNFCKYLWIQPQSSAALPASSTTSHCKTANCCLNKKSWYLSLLLLLCSGESSTWASKLFPHPQSFVNYHLCKCFHPVPFLTKLRKRCQCYCSHPATVYYIILHCIPLNVFFGGKQTFLQIQQMTYGIIKQPVG